MKKYELLKKDTIQFNDKTLYRIRALIDFGRVSKGDLGGYIEKEGNLSQKGNAWVSDNAKVSDNARVYDDARVSGYALVSDKAKVSDDARVYGDAWVSDYAWVSGKARVYDDARVYGDAWVYNDAKVSGNAKVPDEARVSGNAQATTRVININFLSYNVTLTDNHIQIGCKQFTYEVALKLSEKDCGNLFSSEEFKEMWKHKKLLLELIKLKRPDLFKKEGK